MADFTLNPDFSFKKKAKYSTIVSEFESGAEQRRSRWGSTLREWHLVFKNRPASDVATVQALFDSKAGVFSSFTWTNPDDGNDYTVRFKDDSFEPDMIAYGVYNFEFDLIEVK